MTVSQGQADINMKDFEELAKKREEEASQLTDVQIWKSVITKALTLDVDIRVVADILLQSVPDIGVIFAQLKRHHSNGDIDDLRYHDLLEILIEKLEADETADFVDFDPLKYDESE